MQKVTLTSKISKLESQYIASDFGDDVMLMNMVNGDYIHINPVGKAIWNKLTTPISIQDICNELTSEYEIDASTCEQDVIAFVSQLEEQSIVEVQNS